MKEKSIGAQPIQVYQQMCRKKFHLGDVVSIPSSLRNGMGSYHGIVEQITPNYITVKFENCNYRQSIHITEALEMNVEYPGNLQYDENDTSMTLTKLLKEIHKK